MEINEEVKLPVTSGIIKLFKLEIITNVTTTYYYTPVTNTLSTIFWNGNEYIPFPIEISDITFSSTDAPGRPTLTLSNVLPGKVFGTLAFLHGDLVGSKITYIRTLKNYLGIGSSISFAPLKYIIAMKKTHTKAQIEFELRSYLDKPNAYLPKRQMLHNEFPGLGLIKTI